ncbi:hypothetical protein SCLCIDRAFT_129315 [Scleroderma citrinum Foug A]|uniref:Thioredoxin domain-containing protein n=1 Tax=Scleroderma citrinum Foug A TaxID=1036808 RepID=A0A0C3DP06_9AGAM|nr:hypothetical protein SCLCIDRAFT_129315 [Scleroderma citrinum Foug A]
MKLQTLLPSLLAVAGLANAQYFSAGWAPGQPIPTQSSPPPQTQQHPVNPAVTVSNFFDTLLTGGAVSALASLVGLNVSAPQEIDWDDRIPLITDSNYEDVIVRESMTPEEEKQRVWFLVITVTSGQPDSLSKYIDDVFDQTFNYTLQQGGLPHIRFGRIDYLDVTALTTKWAVWTAPMLVVLKDRGQTLRFYNVKSTQMQLNAEVLYEFLKEERWQGKEPWKSAYGPGGEREWILDFLASVLSTVYGYLVRVPKWLLYIISGGAASVIINFMHKPSAQARARAQAQRPAPKPKQPVVAGSASDVSKSTATAKSEGASKRKGKN